MVGPADSADYHTEGNTVIFAPAEGTHTGPIPAVGPATRNDQAPFLNPAMRVNRDLSVATVAAFARSRGRGIDVADVLAATGARSLRLARECPPDLDVSIAANDAHAGAVAAMRAGIAANGELASQRLTVHEGSAHAFLAGGRWDVIDIDPFGSPAPFLDAAMRAIRHKGLLMVTATDTGALAGKYPRVCRRRYGATPATHAPWSRDVGLRILVAAVARSAGRLDRGIEPVWTVGRDHWMRACVRVVDGRSRADATWRHIGHLYHDDEGWPYLADGRHEPVPAAGPLWIASLQDRAFLAAMQDEWAVLDGIAPATQGLVERLASEVSEALPLDLGWLAQQLGHDPRPRDELVAKLREQEHLASRCHLDPQAIRTTAPKDTLERVWLGGDATRD